ncbi:MAG: asnB [Acidobacteria bacterium]|nr:asnB [Acidobacteriota bacterium]
MIAAQRHRGPDGEGFHDNEGVSLGHCRLAIIDTSDAGHQPMSDHGGRYWITYNGEIYNYIELAEELKKLGHVFRGHSDTEVLLAAYVQWGSDCLKRLRGMFAFAIWDSYELRLFAARDRLGIKPFHYYTDGDHLLAFSSELKALLEFSPAQCVNQKLAADYLAWNLLDHEAAETMLAGIHRLPAAHALSWQARVGLKLWRYWDFEVNEELHAAPERRKLLEKEFRERFEDVVQLHLRSDVPVGSALSGGLDSSAIVCVINNELRRKGIWRDDWQHVFSACFDEPAIDERPYMNEVQRATGCQSHEVFPNGEQFRAEMDQWLWYQEEPVAGTGPYAHYCVARLAKASGVKVLLDGQGADEQLAGYRKFILVYLRQLSAASHYARAAYEAARFFSSPAILRTSDFSYGRRYLFKSLSEVDDLWNGAAPPSRPPALGVATSLGKRTEADIKQYSLPLLLRYEDRNTMAFGIESRVPFVDHVFVEWLATLPADMRLSDGWTKRIMRGALRGILPERIRTRKSKLGFSTPFASWLNGPLAGWVRESLQNPEYLSEIVDQRGVARLLGRFQAGTLPASSFNLLFRCAVYESWARQYLAARRVPAAVTEMIEIAVA